MVPATKNRTTKFFLLVKIVFRVDATLQIGTGHFMRCLTLADALKQRGDHIRFVSRNLPTHFHEMLNEKGIGLAALPKKKRESHYGNLAHSSWLDVSQTDDAQATGQALSGHEWDWLVVDHYALDARWGSSLRRFVNQIMVIDDLADRAHDCDVLLDQNLYTDMMTRYLDKVPAHCQLLTGPQYALLRDEFPKLRKQVSARTGVVKRVLAFFGGVDADNYTLIAIKALAGLGMKGIAVDVVIGAQHPLRFDIEKICARLDYVCHVQTSNMAQLMAAADLAIGAGGSTSWERCCLGVPAVLVALAENQTDIAKALDSCGACIYLGTKEVVDSNTIQRTIADLLDTPSQLEVASQRAFSLVDGLGVDRVCRVLGC
jgi:UDP-2,4-diacetamido-2,4,6-trideoxy-beta-L-altropyranose hydrolase